MNNVVFIWNHGHSLWIKHSTNGLAASWEVQSESSCLFLSILITGHWTDIWRAPQIILNSEIGRGGGTSSVRAGTTGNMGSTSKQCGISYCNCPPALREPRSAVQHYVCLTTPCWRLSVLQFHPHFCFHLACLHDYT